MEGGYCERLPVTRSVTCGTGGQAAATATAKEEGNGEVLHGGLISPGSRCNNSSQTLRFGKRPHFVSGSHFDPEAEDLSEEHRNLRTRQTASRMTVEVLDEDQGHPEADG